MNAALFLSLLRTNMRTFLSYAAGSVLYLSLIIWTYPAVANNEGVSEMLKGLPEEMQKLFGLEGGIGSLGEYMAADYYGLLYVLIVLIFCVMMAVQAVARLVDQGSMAYLLATPVARTKIALTQAAVLLVGLFLICTLTMLGGLFLPTVLIDGAEFDKGAFVQINLAAFLLFALVAGYSFFFSCLLNDEKQALGAAAVTTVLFYALNVAGKLSEDLSWLTNVSFFSAYDPQGLAAGTVDLLPQALGLGGGALICFALGVWVFQKRDLPL